MKNLLCLLLTVCAAYAVAQEKPIIIEDNILTDYSTLPIYDRLIEVQNGDTVFKEEFKHLDDIEIHSITYLSDGLRVKGHYLKPKAEGEYPCIIYNRGGNREFGMNKIGTFIFWLSELVAKGYVVAASQYRGVAGGEGREEFGGAEVNDVLVLIDALNEIGGADTSRIGMLGWSRGGMMTYLAMTKTDRLKAVAVGGAVSDLRSTIQDRPEMEKHVIAELVPSYYDDREAQLTKRSAIDWPERFPKNVPLLMMHGTSDWRVKPDQSLRLALELEKERVPFRLIMFEGGDHGINEFEEEVMGSVVDWFDRYLRDGQDLPNMEYHGR